MAHEVTESEIRTHADPGSNPPSGRSSMESPHAKGAAAFGNGLPPQAWLVRYDYKAAVFAELQNDHELALR